MVSFGYCGESKFFFNFDEPDVELFKHLQDRLIDILVDWSYHSSLADSTVEHQLSPHRSRQSDCQAHRTKPILLPDLNQRALPQVPFSGDFDNETMLHRHQISFSRLQAQLRLDLLYQILQIA